VAVTHYASRPLAAPLETADQLSKELKLLFREMGGSSKVCGIGISSPDALIRIIEQPETPTKLLRDALRLNGMMLLNQDCKDFVLDCDQIDASHAAASGEPASLAETGAPRQHRYLVGGLPRAQVTAVAEALEKNSLGVGSLQLAPICAFNAFEFAHPEIFNDHAFFLVDIGIRTRR
jgi:hypothetical protein